MFFFPIFDILIIFSNFTFAYFLPEFIVLSISFLSILDVHTEEYIGLKGGLPLSHTRMLIKKTLAD